MKTVADIVTNFRSNDKIAIIYKTGFRTFRFTYVQLYDQIIKTAGLLEKYGLKKGDKIIIWGYNGPDWGIVFLAAALKGIIVVPIDYMALQDYVARIQSIVKAKLIVHSEYKIPQNVGIKSFILEHLEKLIHGIPLKDVMPDVDEQDTLEIVFTSGTTGNPKGVILTHKNVISNIESIKKCIKVTSDQTFLSLLPMSHMLEQTPGFLGPLSSGCSIVYVKSLRPTLIFKALSQEDITNVVLVPRLLKLFADSVLREAELQHFLGLFKKLFELNLPKKIKKKLFWRVHVKFGKDFQYFIMGGAPLPAELQLFWEKMGFTVIQGYGLTECAPVLTCNTQFEQKIGSVGKPVPGVELRFGKDGEIYAKGDSITPGYYNDTKKTAELFENGWMKTGDVGFSDKEGYVFLKGRKKDVIVTSGGEKAYPEDVEKVLLESKEVKDACVVGLPTSEGEQVHAEVILKTKTNLRALIEYANKKLNQVQQITSYSIWPGQDFPRTTTMKIKKPAVLEQILRRKGKKSFAKKPSESKLFEILTRIGGVKAAAIKPDAKLSLDLKLNSVNRVELVSMLEQEFNIDIDEEEITGEKTFSELDEIIKKRQHVTQKNIFRRWLLWLPVRIFRMTYNILITDNAIRIFCWRKITGKENLKHLNGPAIFTSNHIGYFDAPNILMSLPFKIRSRIAIAAWQEYFDVPKNQIFKRLLFNFYYEYASLFMNIFPFPRQKGFRRNLEYTGELLDKGWNILFFPEGEHSKTRKLQPFRLGIGWLVKEMRVPVVPIKHSGLEKIMAGDEHQLPRFGKVTIKIGKPVILDYTKSIPELTNELQDIIAKM